MLGNLTLLAVLAPRVCREVGWWRSAALFLFAGAAANQLASLTITRPVIGASGVVAAVMAVHLVLFPRSRLAPFIGLWIALQAVFATIALDFADVAWPAHMAGAAFGAMFALLARVARRRLINRGRANS